MAVVKNIPVKTETCVLVELCTTFTVEQQIKKDTALFDT